jgi:hypothetical protein
MADELSDLAKVRKDLLWGLYSDLRTHARHAEALRSNVVNFMIVIASVLVAMIANDGRVAEEELPLCVVVVAIGLLGLAFAASYTELYERNRSRAMRVRQALDDEYFTDGTTMESLLRDADSVHQSALRYRWSRRLTGSTQRFWLVLPGLIVLAGLLLGIIAV